MIKMANQDVIVLTRAVVFNEGNELLVQHGLTPETNFYRVPGGHVEFREKLEDCVVREIREETGLKVEVIRLLWVRDFLDHYPGHSIEFFFLGNIRGGKFISTLEVKSGSEFLFMKLEELENVIFYPKEFIPKLKSLRENRNWAEENPYIRSAN